MNILLCGYTGYMGREVIGLAEGSDINIVGGIDPMAEGSFSVPVAKSFDEAITEADCIVDFSHHCLTESLLDFAVSNDLPLVLATTGQTAEEKEMIYEASKKIPLFFAANYSLGVALLIELAKKTASVMDGAEIEIIEKHHNRKLDAPSGTALAIAEAICEVRPDAYSVTGRSGNGKRDPNEIGIHAVRMGNIVGEHEVIVGTPNQTITLKHEAHSRALFAEGALAAARFLAGKEKGLYDMKSMISL